MTAFGLIDQFDDDVRVDLALGSGDAVTITKQDLYILMGRWGTMDDSPVQIEDAGNRLVALGGENNDWLFAIYKKEGN